MPTNPLPAIIDAFYQRVRRDLDTEAQHQAGEMRDDIIKGWPVDTGRSRAAWQGPNKIAEGHYRLSNDIPYAWTIEHGGYPGVGPKTVKYGASTLGEGVQIEGGIFPKQKPAAPVRRAIAKGKGRMRELAKRIRLS